MVPYVVVGDWRHNSSDYISAVQARIEDAGMVFTDVTSQAATIEGYYTMTSSPKDIKLTFPVRQGRPPSLP
jgi:hypothetical protein